MKKFYVYLYLREDGSPYYVGKGSGRRDKERHSCGVPANPNQLMRVATNLTEAGAWKLEKQLISFYGRESEGGSLVNKSSGGAGGSGWKQTPESNKKRSEAQLSLKRKVSEKQKASQSFLMKGCIPHNKGVRGVIHYRPCVYRGERFASVSVAADKFGVSVSYVCKVCRKKLRDSYYL